MTMRFASLLWLIAGVAFVTLCLVAVLGAGAAGTDGRDERPESVLVEQPA
ncbi:hypothetical protein ACFPM7_00750 [Actinokineospora guangxiensis]|uniref:Uncharacterized protein n=1 Tax=Actinokineospora guangxiensis TaxID=1490288 RepID=A0ABW0EFZ8_9PSEU